MFLWRLLSNGLPVFQNLLTRRICVDPICHVCLEAVESVIHVFKHCHFARVVWAISGIPMVVIVAPYTNLWDWIFTVKQGISADQFVEFVCI